MADLAVCLARMIGRQLAVIGTTFWIAVCQGDYWAGGFFYMNIRQPPRYASLMQVDRSFAPQLRYLRGIVNAQPTTWQPD
jgi:hypothetical protein